MIRNDPIIGVIHEREVVQNYKLKGATPEDLREVNRASVRSWRRAERLRGTRQEHNGLVTAHTTDMQLLIGLSLDLEIRRLTAR